jgi:putative ABC transport system ATP-binding protein
MARGAALAGGGHPRNGGWSVTLKEPPTQAPSGQSSVVHAEDLKKIYSRGAEEVRALDGVSFRIDKGEFVSIVGPSGSGKTTLLQLIGGMDRPTSGRLVIAGQEMGNLNDAGLTRLRRDHVGFVFQHFGLLPTLTVAENVAIPSLFKRRDARKQVDELLERVGLTQRRNHRPNQLSGGEMQRVAIARALINDPSLLLADEPTGNLDSATSERILALLHELHQGGLTVVVVTHNEALAHAAQRSIVLNDGVIVSGA